MATTLQLRRGTAAEAAAFTGAVGELFIDTQNKLVYLHDGVTAGGVLVGGSGGGSAVVSGTVSGNTLTLTNSDASTVNVNVSTLAQDIHVTSATVSGSIITLHNNNGTTVDIQLPSSVTGFLPGEVTEDMLPKFDGVYDLGSPTNRWYDVNASNSVSIGNATLKEVDGVLTVNAEIVASNLVGTDLVADEALLGTVLHTGSTITPEGTTAEYFDAKGTLTVDGNLVVSDDLTVRNKISVKQSPVKAGTVIGFEETPSTSQAIYLTDGLAQTAGLRGINFTSNGNQHNFVFDTAANASAFNDQISVGQEIIFGMVVVGQGAFTTTVTISSKTYNAGTSDIYFTYNYISGIEFYQFANWTVWCYPWYSYNAYQMNSISYTGGTPAKYAVVFDGTVPEISTTSEMYVNGSTGVGGTSIRYLLTNASAAKSGANKYISSNDIRTYFALGDVLTYKTPTTSLVFGDEQTGLSKAITYNESTGVISYAGLVNAININSNNNSLYSANIQNGVTPGYESSAIGYNSRATAYDSTAFGASARADGYYSTAIGAGSNANNDYSISVGYNVATGSYNTMVGGGDNIGGMYHNTVIGMAGRSSSGWMWGNGSHVTVLGTQYSYIQAAGDYATIINGGNSAYHMSASNLIGGSTSFAPQQYHAEIALSAYQYAYVSSTATIYPQFGYISNGNAPHQMTTTASTDSSSTLRLDQNNCQIAQGKVTLTVQKRSADVWGIYEIAFIARRDSTGTTTIVSQSTTTLGNNSAATYWNTPTMYLNGNNLQFQITPTASMNNAYMSVHVGGTVRVSVPY